MNSNDIIILNFEETRRRSEKLWKGIPTEYLTWRPDKDAMSIIEMVRHVLEAQHIYHFIIKRRGDLTDYLSPWDDRTLSDVEDELGFAKPFRKTFFEMIRSFSENDLETVIIERPEKRQKRKLGDYLLRIGYHEAVHTGQMLGYLRTLGVERPQIWD